MKKYRIVTNNNSHYKFAVEIRSFFIFWEHEGTFESFEQAEKCIKDNLESQSFKKKIICYY
jgi:hypothetical protein